MAWWDHKAEVPCLQCQENFLSLHAGDAICQACLWVNGLSFSTQDFYLRYLEEDAQATYEQWKRRTIRPGS